MPDHPTNPEVHLLDRDFYVAPHEHYRWLRENAPVYWEAEADADGGIWGVSRHEDILYVSKNMPIFCSGKSSRPERDTWVPTMINLDDPLHKRRRSLVNRGFTPRRIGAHEAKIRRICRDLLDSVAGSGKCDFVRDIAAPLPMIMIGDMLGVKPEDRDKLLRWSDELVGGGEGAKLPQEEQRAHMTSVFVDYVEYARQVLADRRKNPQDDLVSILLESDIDGDQLSEDEIIQESLLILIGGDETTRHVITGGMLALIQNPGERQKLIDAPSKIPMAVEEMLRWVSPIVNMNRTATQDTELHGQKIREGDRVLLLYASGNRDEAAFPDADRFDVERQPNQHVAFGGTGTHFCLGASLARLELRVMFEEALKRLPDLELAVDASELPLRASNFIVGLESMPVTFAPKV